MIEDLIELANQTALGRNDLEKGAIGYRGYGFIFRDMKELYPEGVAHSGLFPNIYDELESVKLMGALKTLIPSLSFTIGGYIDEPPFNAVILVQDPEDRRYPVIINFRKGKFILGAIHVKESELAEEWTTFINFDARNLTNAHVDDLFETIEYLLQTQPQSDFNTIHRDEWGKWEMGVKDGKPYFKKSEYIEPEGEFIDPRETEEGDDVYYEFYDIIYTFPKVKQDVPDNILINQVMEDLLSYAEEYADNTRIAYQVLGLYFAENKVAIPEETKDLILSHSDWESEEKNFTNTEIKKKRKDFLETFRKNIISL